MKAFKLSWSIFIILMVMVLLAVIVHFKEVQFNLSINIEYIFLFLYLKIIGIISLALFWEPINSILTKFSRKPTSSNIFIIKRSYFDSKSSCERNIHFKDMHRRPEKMDENKEIREFRKIVRRLNESEGVKIIYAETIISSETMELIGFKKIALSSPLTYFSIFLTTLIRKRKLNKHERNYCYLYKLDVKEYIQKLDERKTSKIKTAEDF